MEFAGSHQYPGVPFKSCIRLVKDKWAIDNILVSSLSRFFIL